MSKFLLRSGASIIPLHSVAASAAASAAASGGCAVAQTPAITPPLEGEVPVGVSHIAIMLTRRCNMSCAHCSVESSPHIKGEPTEDELLNNLRAAHRSGVRSVLLTGGEPMLREKIALKMLEEAQRLGMVTAMTSNGYWGKTPLKAEQTIARLKAAGLQLLTISYDRYHADYQGPQPSVNIARAATQAKLVFNVSITRTNDEADLEAIVAPFADVPRANLRFYDVQPVGRARDFDLQTLRGEVGGFCNACDAPALADDGRLLACNGPSYFSDDASPLVAGSLQSEGLELLLRRHREDSILEAIRTRGPAWLLGELEQLPGFENWARPAYGGMCDLCLHLNSDAAATAALRARLDDGRLRAEFAARRQIIEATRRAELNRSAVNQAGAAQVWWRAIGDPATLRAADGILSRADLDWSAQLEYLAQCGLAGPLLPALDEPELRRWAPAFWIENLRQQAMRDALRALMQKDALREIAAAAREVGATGILLKGGALIALNQETSGELPLRSCCDLDVYFAPSAAALVHQELARRGFGVCDDGIEVEARRRHQLPPLVKGVVCVEIHQTLLPAFCGAPERAMRRGARALADAELRGLRVLAPEAFLLHNALHCSKHLWTHGLKMAYDFAWIIERFPALNWHWLQRLAARTGMKRGFWAPLAVAARALELPIPNWFLAQAPQGARQRKLERIAGRHLFDAVRADFQDNPWICHPLYALQSDSWAHRARHLGDLLLGDYAVEMRRQRASTDPGHRRGRWEKLSRARRTWRNL